jgi:hypothetical protein
MLTTRQINTRVSDFPICDVCGRTVLRGERVSAYINGSARRSVCELCETRALHEGWVREGSLDGLPSSSSTAERRRSIFSRRRGRRETTASTQGAVSTTWDEDSAASSWSRSATAERPAERRSLHRQVHAVPTDDGQRAAKAVELFNRSEHTRTVSGVARSLGRPAVHVSPVPGRPSLVSVVVSWELCWYRYEVDLSDDGTNVRVAAQGYELDDLDEQERLPNALADEFGQVTVGQA